jgi:hypothetical protein
MARLLFAYSRTGGCTSIGDLYIDELWGDLDCDGDADEIDALILFAYLAGLPPPVDVGTCKAVGQPFPAN